LQLTINKGNLIKELQ